LTSLFVAANPGSRTHVVDFGGGLGSTYQQTRRFLELADSKIEWVVVEQEAIAKIGKESFENSNLQFVASIDQIPEYKVDLALFSGSLCYLEDPYETIRKIMLRSPKFIVLDRTPFVKSDQDTYGVQFVPASLFRASYPITFFGQKNLFDLLSVNYMLIEKWISADQPDLFSTLEGSLWKLREAR
jgi:putative methyltransferase (TIGR04325 family)